MDRDRVIEHFVHVFKHKVAPQRARLLLDHCLILMPSAPALTAVHEALQQDARLVQLKLHCEVSVNDELGYMWGSTKCSNTIWAPGLLWAWLHAGTGVHHQRQRAC